MDRREGERDGTKHSFLMFGVICALVLVASAGVAVASASRASIFSDREKMANAYEVNGVVPDVIDVAPASTAEVNAT